MRGGSTFGIGRDEFLVNSVFRRGGGEGLGSCSRRVEEGTYGLDMSESLVESSST